MSETCPACEVDVTDARGQPDLPQHLVESAPCRAALRDRVERAAAVTRTR